jgi:hypothetical protein
MLTIGPEVLYRFRLMERLLYVLVHTVSSCFLFIYVVFSTCCTLLYLKTFKKKLQKNNMRLIVILERVGSTCTLTYCA